MTVPIRLARFDLFCPEPQPREPRRECCIRCRRGTKEHGLTPCGYALNCPTGCHERDSA